MKRSELSKKNACRSSCSLPGGLVLISDPWATIATQRTKHIIRYYKYNLITDEYLLVLQCSTYCYHMKWYKAALVVLFPLFIFVSSFFFQNMSHPAPWGTAAAPGGRCQTSWSHGPTRGGPCHRGCPDVSWRMESGWVEIPDVDCVMVMVWLWYGYGMLWFLWFSNVQIIV